VVAPLIEESDNIDLENVNKLTRQFELAFGKSYKIGTLHGKMSSKEKDIIMKQFDNNGINILISTTVIEVGIDVKNATMMVIFDAKRFGLSTLHQLRGRVGRSDLQSYCILISDAQKERLKIMTETNDGFTISEEDFRLRGQGDLFGVKQTGDMSFKIADLKKDYKILLQAKEDSAIFIKNNLIDKYPYIKKAIEKSANLD
jgi:ATP-dependent DNA helicase RecG